MSAASTKRIAAVALAAAGVAGLAGSSAQAAPFLTARLLGSTSAGGPFTSSVNVGAGDQVFYQVQITLGNEGATNASATGFTTITNWIPSNGATSPTAGLNSLLFSLTQSAGDSIQSNFSTQISGTSTGGGTWGAGTGFAFGTPTARGNGNNNLLNVRLFRESGNFDGVAGTPVANGEATGSESLETLTIGTGSFSIASGGTSGTVNLDLTGFTTGQIIAAYRWRSAANTGNVNYNETVTHQNNSTTAADPIIVFQPLQLVPEPATLGLLGMAGLGLLARRRRA